MTRTKEKYSLAPYVGRKLLFPLGQTLATPGAIEVMKKLQVNPYTLLARHISGDWGDLDEPDKEANEQALKDGSRIFSAYHIGAHKLWLITEVDRSATTILLPSEY